MTKVPSNETELTAQYDVMVAMRDGVKLACDIYFPPNNDRTGQNQWPVLMERTPYNKQGANRSERRFSNGEPMLRTEIASYFARSGYIVVIQDCRGRYQSEGVFSKYVNEAEDGFDTMAWLVDQPWCSGKIGTFGVSYGAHTQIAAACLNPPGLASMFLDSGGFASAYHGGIRRGGAFELKQATWAHRHALRSPKTAADPERKQALEDVDLREWFSNMPWSPGHSPLSAAPEYEAYFFEQWRNGEYTEYWRRLGLSALDYYDNIPDIPVMILNSWYDPYVSTSTTNFAALSDKDNSPVFLTMGPWTHGQRSKSFAGNVEFGADAIFDNHFDRSYLDYRCDWFDWSLKKKERPSFKQDEAVTVFVMGGGNGAATDEGKLNHGGRWCEFSAWPPSESRDTHFYFHDDANMTTSIPAEKSTVAKFHYDPQNPTPTIGGAVTSGEPLMSGGAFDQREYAELFGCESPGRDLKDRPDTISFATPPLEDDIAVVGMISAKLWISSSCVDTDFTVKLLDVHPPSQDFPEGFAMNVTDGIIRARYRNGGHRTELLEPGRIYEITVDLSSTANLFARGHRIRVDIASCSFPQFDLNSNSGESEGEWTTTVRAENAVYLNKDYPSHIVLPTLANLKDSN